MIDCHMPHATCHMPSALASNLPGGIYVHIPFCVCKCRYCDFYSTTELDLIPRFLAALDREIQMVPCDGLVFDSIYLGGGTPSVLSPDQAQRVLERLFERFSLLPDVEVNFELNPGTSGRDKLAAYRAAGLNRMTIGVQSFSDPNLQFLGRVHSAEEARRAVEASRAAGFGHLGLDLIYGLPGQSVRQWRADMQAAISFNPEHLSCYMLTVESGTPLHADVCRGRVSLAGEAAAAALYRETVRFLGRCGYGQYEVSNFALSTGGGHANRSRHNQKYWNFAPYIGLGPGAHTFIEPQRRWNRRNVHRYCEDIERGKLPAAGSESLSREQLIIEAIYLGLRQTDGIELAAFQRKFGMDFENCFAKQMEELTTAGFARLRGGRLKLTTEGMLLLDSVCAALVGAMEC